VEKVEPKTFKFLSFKKTLPRVNNRPIAGFARWCLFSNQKSQFGEIMECQAIKDFGTFYGHLVYDTAIS
jgi:hypothetical protein